MNTDRDSSNTDRRRLRDYVPRPTGLLSTEVLVEGIEVTVDGPDIVEQDSSVMFEITFKNRFPFTIELPVESRPWTWDIDGVPDADVSEPVPKGASSESFAISGRESETVDQYWSGRIRRARNGPFEPLTKGQHTVSVVINTPVDDPPRDTFEFTVK